MREQLRKYEPNRSKLEPQHMLEILDRLQVWPLLNRIREGLLDGAEHPVTWDQVLADLTEALGILERAYFASMRPPYSPGAPGSFAEGVLWRGRGQAFDPLAIPLRVEAESAVLASHSLNNLPDFFRNITDTLQAAIRNVQHTEGWRNQQKEAGRRVGRRIGMAASFLAAAAFAGVLWFAVEWFSSAPAAPPAEQPTQQQQDPLWEPVDEAGLEEKQVGEELVGMPIRGAEITSAMWLISRTKPHRLFQVLSAAHNEAGGTSLWTHRVAVPGETPDIEGERHVGAMVEVESRAQREYWYLPTWVGSLAWSTFELETAVAELPTVTTLFDRSGIRPMLHRLRLALFTGKPDVQASSKRLVRIQEMLGLFVGEHNAEFGEEDRAKLERIVEKFNRSSVIHLEAGLWAKSAYRNGVREGILSKRTAGGFLIGGLVVTLVLWGFARLGPSIAEFWRDAQDVEKQGAPLDTSGTDVPPDKKPTPQPPKTGFQLPLSDAEIAAGVSPGQFRVNFYRKTGARF